LQKKSLFRAPVTGTLKTYYPHYRTNLKLALPVVISQLAHTLVQTADSIIVGQFVGTTALAAVSLVSAMFVIVLVIGIGISYGLTPLIAQESIQKNYAACGRLLAASLLINMITGIILFLLIYAGAELVLHRLGQSKEVVALARPFLLMMGISVIPLMVFNTFKQFAEGLGFTKQAMKVSIWGNVLNVCLGIILVRGMFGFPKLGVMGVGWSTLIDRTVMAIAMTIYVSRSMHFRNYVRTFSFRKIHRDHIRKILKLGAPVALQYSFEISAFAGAAILIGTISPTAQAAHQVAISLASLTYMMASGIAAAAAVKSGNNFGLKDYHGLRVNALASYHIVLAFMGLTAVLFILCNQLLPHLYTADPAVIAIAAQLMIIAGIFQLLDGSQVVGLGILRGMGDVNIPAFITFLAYWVIGIPVAWLLGITLGLGVTGVWYGLTLGLLVAAALLFLRFRKISARLMGNH
jgi:MATE family multidrug resistance protein